MGARPEGSGGSRHAGSGMRDDLHGAMADRSRQRVNLKNLLLEPCPTAGRLVGASLAARTITGCPSAAAAWLRRPRGWLAYQPQEWVACPVSGMWTKTGAGKPNGVNISVSPVGPWDLSDGYITTFALRPEVSRSGATGFLAQCLGSRVANARPSSARGSPCGAG